MCHTSFMKKSFVLLLPIIALLTACEFKIDYTSDKYSAGLSHEPNSSYSNYYVEKSYEYFSGDRVDTENTNKAELSFNTTENKSSLSKEEVEPLISCDLDSLTVTVTETYNVGEKVDGLFVGADSTYVDGYLTLTFSETVKDVIIKASPYYYITNAWNEDRFGSDSNVAIAINNSRYIKLSEIKEENENKIVTTECRYNMEENTKSIQIKVGQRRAFIEKITLYF